MNSSPVKSERYAFIASWKFARTQGIEKDAKTGFQDCRHDLVCQDILLKDTDICQNEDIDVFRSGKLEVSVECR